MSRIVILGAGPTGLGAAWRLRELGYDDWAIYERNDHVGGLSASVRDEHGYVWDYGGHIIFSHYEAFDRIVQELLGDDVVAHQRESWVWLMDRFIKYPFQNNFHFLPEDVTLECVMGLLRAREDGRALENFEDWIYGSFGEGIAKHFLIPYNKKVWSIHPKGMDFNWIGERVAVVDMERVLSNIIHRREDSTWGPNNEFLFPLHGGTGGLFEPFAPRLGERLHLDSEAVRVDLSDQTVRFADGHEDHFDSLLSTMPVDRLVEMLHPAADDAVRAAAGRLKWAAGYIVGVGVHAPCPSDKNWMYFPEDDSPFYRVTYLSNYSPNVAPSADRYSLLCEISHSVDMPESKDDIVERTLRGLKSSRLLTEEDERRVESVQLLDVDYLLPVPFLGRNEVMRTIHRYLEERNVYSRGRFGGWKYEVGNMDHSVMQGIEWAGRIAEGREESVYVTGL